jgi:glycosyltransferase involved in cell wall biosynthesis
MRIAQLAPLYEPVPPRYYGGTERVVAGLTESLVRDGHDVVLFASGDSVTSAELVPCCARALRLDAGVKDPMAHHIVQLGKLVERVSEFDVIHNHLDYLAFPLARALPLQMITTVHGRLDLPDLQPLYTQYPEIRLVSISEAQRAPLPHARWLATVYNGIDVKRFTFRERPGSYLAFLGRISPEKGLPHAIEIARAVDMPLRIAAKIDPVDRVYFTETIKPMLRDPRVEYIGEIDEAQKDEFLGHAYAYLFPITWPEPFGITMIEAMACGTPVIAMAQGSVPEVVVRGQTGFICRSLREMVDAVQQVDQLSRRACRAHVEHRFSVEAMAAAYEAVYRKVLSEDKAYREVAQSARHAAVDRARAIPGIRPAASLVRGRGTGNGGSVIHAREGARDRGITNQGDGVEPTCSAP